MINARFLVAALLVAGAALAACSGNFGSGATPPNSLLPAGNLAGVVPTPSPTPKSASNIVTYGSTAAFQVLPSAAGYGGAIAFTVPSPKPSGFTDIAIGATLSVVRPSDAPDLNLATRGKKGKKRERPARSLVYLTLLATHDMTLEAYPRIAIDVPREIVTIYRENEFGMALYNAGTKDGTFRLAAAAVDSATPPPVPTAVPSAPPPPTAIPLSASAAPSSPAGASPAPTRPRPSPSPTLPPQRIAFAATAAVLKLTANRPVVFALYALPVETPSPSPAPKLSGRPAAGRAKGGRGAAPVASGSPLPDDESPAATGSPLPSGSPTASTSPVATGSAAAASTLKTSGTAAPSPAGS